MTAHNSCNRILPRIKSVRGHRPRLQLTLVEKTFPPLLHGKLRGIERLRLILRDGKILPRSGLQLFGGEHDLTDMVRVVSKLAIDRFEDGMAFVTDIADPLKIGRLELIERRQEAIPSLIPAFAQVFPSGKLNFEFRIAIAPGFFAIGSQKSPSSATACCPQGVRQ